MRSWEARRASGVFTQAARQNGRCRDRLPRQTLVCALAPACLLLLLAATVMFAQGPRDDEAYDVLDRRGTDPIDEITAALHRWSKVFLIVGAVLLGIVALKIFKPFEVYRSTNERMLKRAVRGVDDLLKRIQEEAETTTSETKGPPADAGVLAGMVEMVEFDRAEQVPPYVLTVNDLMLDSVRNTLKRLERFREGNAARYRGYMVSVLKGIKTITEQCALNGVPSSLAVDVKDYFQDERRYRAWGKLLHRLGRRGEHKELADAFLLFMRDVREGRPLAAAQQAAAMQNATVAVGATAPEVPVALNEETLPVLQKAAVREAAHLVSFVRTGRPSDPQYAWQFALVQRQQQLHSRDEAKRMLVVFISCERQTLPRLTKTRMLPCRTWPHVLYMLGVKSEQGLRKRVEDRLLSIQEIIILQKAFLQTFARKDSLAYVYGQGEEAELMMNLHVPQVRREALTLLRRCHETGPDLFDRATEELDEQETPEHHEVARLMRHYVHQRHEPPDIRRE